MCVDCVCVGGWGGQEESALGQLDAQLRASFGREMELRRASHFKRTLGMAHATAKAYDAPLPKLKPPPLPRSPAGGTASAGAFPGSPNGSPSGAAALRSPQGRRACEALPASSLPLSPSRPSTSVSVSIPPYQWSSDN